MFEIKIDNWYDYLNLSEKELMKLIPSAVYIGNKISSFVDLLEEIGIKVMDGINEEDTEIKFKHPLMLEDIAKGYFHEANAFFELVDKAYRNGFRKDRKVKSISSSVYGFFDSLPGISFDSPYEDDEKKYRKKLAVDMIVKKLTDLLKLPSGYIVVEAVSPFEYFSSPRSGIYGDEESCFLKGSYSSYVWDLLEMNNGKVITIKVYEDESKEKLIGGGRFLLLEFKVGDKIGKIAFNFYSNKIPLSYNLVYIILRKMFDNEKITFTWDSSIALYLHENFLYINNTPVFIIGDVKDKGADERIHLYCICGNSTKRIKKYSVKYPEYNDFNDMIVGCSKCFGDKLVKYVIDSISEDYYDYDAISEVELFYSEKLSESLREYLRELLEKGGY